MNNVLIIDDDKELCTLIKRSVLSEDIEADFCNTGKEGLAQVREKEYQLVILDVMMTGMDGFETLEEIRKESSLPILMFTSKNDSASKVRGLRTGNVVNLRKYRKFNKKHLTIGKKMQPRYRY
ncbi:Stage 0 sporulation protein A homolog [Clostridium neonatale]|nr:Stage 0 sporulation protein A homolog [Clostridium neonatale]CAI3664790.1 Stage 0 sporulation protein A homolog [Clostridium neonatale]